MKSTKLSSTHHFNVAQMRIDLWNRLRSELHLLQKKKKSSDGPENKESVLALLDDLTVIENYYSFPGKKRVKKLQSVVNVEEFSTASNRVNELVRQLVSESFRSNPQLIKDDYEDEVSDSESSDTNGQNGTKNHFEVLFVDNLSNNEEEAMRSKIA